MKNLVVASIIAVIVIATAPAVYALEPHENPDTAQEIFSGISLLRYYSDSLDFVLQKNPEGSETNLENMPFTHVSQALEKANQDFAQSTIDLSYSLVQVYELWDKQRVFIEQFEQFRLHDANKISSTISAGIKEARNKLSRLEQAVRVTGGKLGVPAAPPQSDLRRTYDEIMEKINRIKGMLDLLEESLKGELLKAGKLDELVKPTSITLEVGPLAAFVGDEIYFDGILTCQNEPLPRTEVDILLNSSRYIKVRTDVSGRFQGKLLIPYWYTRDRQKTSGLNLHSYPKLDSLPTLQLPIDTFYKSLDVLITKIEVQAFYHPQDEDTGRYLASLSQTVNGQVLFNETALEVNVDGKAYPGLEATVRGRFDYNQSPPLNQRKVGIYLDDAFISELVVGETFTQKLEIDPQIQPGKHVLTLCALADGRYSPAVTSIVLEVIKDIPVLDFNTPRVAIVPGNIGLGGRLYSDAGSLNGAIVKIGVDSSQTQITTSSDGSFSTKLQIGMGLNLIGSQVLSIQVLPQEPWHASLSTTRSIFMVNAINCGAILIVLIFLGIYLPRKFKRQLGGYPRRVARPVEMITPEPAPAYGETVAAPEPLIESNEESGEPRSRIFYWYRRVFTLVQKLAKAVLRPQQTLREFARDNSKVLGAAGRYLIELTKLVEQLLYSQYRPTEKDVENSTQLSHKIEDETKLRVTTQPVLARQLSGEGTGAQFDLKEASVVSVARAFDFGGKLSATSSWIQLSTWLWALLIVAVVYYACILLLLLPLLVASLAS